MLGLRRHTIKLVPYEPKWAKLFKQEKKCLTALLGDIAIDIQHVGSTAVPGIPSKPILDMVIGVSDLKKAGRTIPLLKKLGYQFKGDGEVPGRLFFVKGTEVKRTHHLGITKIGNKIWREELLFRDYLLRHPKIAKEYGELKLKLFKKFPLNRKSYTAGKHKFIQKILKKAKK